MNIQEYRQTNYNKVYRHVYDFISGYYNAQNLLVSENQIHKDTLNEIKSAYKRGILNDLYEQCPQAEV